MIRHFLISLFMYMSIILSALLILGVAKRFDDVSDSTKSPRKDTAACIAFKFDNCK